jgi:hypothetical protein
LPFQPDSGGRLRPLVGGWVSEYPNFAKQVTDPPVDIGEHVAGGHISGTWQQEKVYVANAFVEGHDVDALGSHNTFHRPHGGAKHRTERLPFHRGELSQGFTVPPSLDDQLTGVGVWAGVMAYIPAGILENDASRSRRLAGYLGTRGTTRSGGLQGVPD